MKTGSGVPPWHLWGGSQTIDAGFGGVNNRTTGGQLAKVAYKRPESWHFMFAARLLEGPGNVNNSISVNFNLTVGVGRAIIQIPSFEVYGWAYAGVFNPTTITTQIYTTKVIGPNRQIGGVAPIVIQNEIDQLVAQDIQLDVSVTNFFGPTAAKVEVSAFFAPRTHVRPDWQLHHFNGGEHGGS